MKFVYSISDVMRWDDGEVALPKSAGYLFDFNSYYGGALALYALRQQIGTRAFEQLERTWVTQSQGKSASTDDFIALAGQVSGQDLTGFLHDWLYSATPPPTPGHPDWTVDPPGSAAATSISGRSLLERGRI